MKRILLPLMLAVTLLTACNCGQSTPQKSDSQKTLPAADSVRIPTGPTVQIRGTSMKLYAPLPEVGTEAPDCILTDDQLQDVKIGSFKGKTVVLNIFPSVDTQTCAASVHEFNEVASSFPKVQVLCISMDLPFAQKRFCGAEGLTKVHTFSAFRSQFPKLYGVQIATGPLHGLCARTVIIINPDGKVGYIQLVPEISHEPDYTAVTKYLKGQISEN